MSFRRITLLFLALGLPLMASAQSSFRIDYANQLVPNFYHVVFDRLDSAPAGQPLTSSYSRDLAGRDGNGAAAIFTFSAAGSASSDGGVLRSKVSASLTKPEGFYSTGGNTNYVKDTSFTIDPNGLPLTYQASITNSFSDTLTVAGAAGLTSIRLNLSATGRIDAPAPNGSSGYYVDQDSSNTIAFYNQPGVYDTHFLSNAIALTPAGKGQVKLSTWTFIYYDLNWDRLFDAGTYSVATDFNSLKIESVSGYDSQGNPVDLYSAVGASGTVYAAVPEPATYGLIAGAIALGFAALRRRKAPAAVVGT